MIILVHVKGCLHAPKPVCSSVYSRHSGFMHQILIACNISYVMLSDANMRSQTYHRRSIKYTRKPNEIVLNNEATVQTSERIKEKGWTTSPYFVNPLKSYFLTAALLQFGSWHSIRKKILVIHGTVNFAPMDHLFATLDPLFCPLFNLSHELLV